MSIQINSNLGNREVGHTLTFYAHTQDGTGAEADASAGPTYRLYEEETGTPLLTGSMALLDTANTTGFYSEQITLSSANGFENDKDYCILVVATVSGVVAGAIYSFRMGTVPADVVEISGDATAADNLETMLDGTGGQTLTANITGNLSGSVGSVAAGGITASSIAADAIGASELAADAVTEIRSLVSGTSDSGTTLTMVDAARTEADTDHWKGAYILFTSGNISGQTRLITGFNAATDTITFAPATTQAVATQNYEILPNGGVDLQLWRGSVPNGLNLGRVDALVGAMDPNVITATVIAADAIGASELAADAVAEIQAGLATSAAVAAIQADTDDIQTRLPATLVGGRMRSHVEAMDAGVITAAVIATDAIDADAIAAGAIDAAAIANGAIDAATFAAGAIDAAAIATDAIDADALAATAVAEIADGIWDEPTAGHNISGTFGQVLFPIRANTAQAGGATTITLDASASAVDDFYNGSLIFLTGGTGALQARSITDYVGATKVATISPAWATNPDATSVFVIVPAATVTGSSATPGDIADAVWDEARGGHVGGGTFGEGVASVQGNVTGSVGSVTGNVGGNVVGSVGSVAAGGITAASIATGAIDADALATDAVDEIVDQVWDELIAGHLAAGSTGEALNNAAAGGSPAAIADAVWDELRAGHVAAGSFGEGVASVQGNVTGSVASVTGNVGGNVNGNVVGSVGSVAAGGITAASIATGAIDADALATDAVDEIVDQTWNELIAGHLGAGSTGEALNNASAGGATPAAIADAVWDEATSGHLTSGTFGQAQNTIRANTAQGGAATTITLDAGASAIDDFYNFTLIFVTGGTGAGQSRMISDYVGATKVATVNTAWGTNPDATSVFVILPFGSIPGAVAPSAADNANAVWDELTAEGRAVGSYGQLFKDNVDATISSRASAAALALVVDQTWDEILAGHLAAGSTGEALNNAAVGGGGGGASPAAIADAVWDEAKAQHEGATIFGNVGQDLDDLEFTGNEG